MWYIKSSGSVQILDKNCFTEDVMSSSTLWRLPPSYIKEHEWVHYEVKCYPTCMEWRIGGQKPDTTNLMNEVFCPQAPCKGFGGWVVLKEGLSFWSNPEKLRIPSCWPPHRFLFNELLVCPTIVLWSFTSATKPNNLVAKIGCPPLEITNGVCRQCELWAQSHRLPYDNHCHLKRLQGLWGVQVVTSYKPWKWCSMNLESLLSGRPPYRICVHHVRRRAICLRATYLQGTN